MKNKILSLLSTLKSESVYKKYILPTGITAVAMLLAVSVFCFASAGSRAAAKPSPSRSEALAIATPCASPPSQTETPAPTLEPTAEPTLEPTPTALPLPCVFVTADFTGADAPVLEQLLKSWGFVYFPQDGKWGDDDAYALSLFQRWAGLEPSASLDKTTRGALLSTFVRYGYSAIPRKKLPLEGRFIGVNAGHQLHADYGLEPLSPEKNSPRKARVSSGTAGVATHVPEYEVNLEVALKLRDSLEGQGARVLMVRTVNNVRISNVERCKLMNKAGVDVYISLHCDGNNNHATHGLHTLIPADRGYQHGAVLEKSQKLAKIMQEELIKATGANDKGFSTRDDLSSFNWAGMPTCLVEMGFMTYPDEDRLLITDAYQKKLVSGYVSGFLWYFQGPG